MGARVVRRGLVAVILLVTGLAAFGVDSSEPVVKKSNAGICHERGTPGYSRTVHFKQFGSVEACLKSGGRLPKNAARKASQFDASKPAHAGDEGVLYGPLVRVIDGDTLIVKVQGADLRVRLVGIDAPESDQPFGERAAGELATLIGEQQCVLVYADGDMYGRLIVHLWVGDLYVNGEMVERGMAWFDTESAQNDLLYRYEEEARAEKRGLWALPASERVEPWTWRKERR